jgi:chemotaxis protein histidine kinase CheA
MDDLKSVTMSYLRDLARKHLGTGYSKLNKKELIAALAEFVPALKKLARLVGVELTAGSKPAAKAAAPATKQPREPSRGKETSAVDKKKKEPEKKAAAPKKEPDKKAAAAPKTEPEKKAAPEAKKEPEKKAAPEAKKEPEKKAAPEAKKEPEKKAAPEAKKEPEKEPEKKAAAPQGRKAPASGQAEPKDEDAASRKHAQIVNFPPRVRLPRSAEEAWQEDTAEMVVESPELEQVFQHAAEPLVEGFFVARMMGERELRRHHLTEEQSPRPTFNGGALGYNEDLGELPLDYGNDLALALARDPHTLFISWDFSPATRARAMEGLDEPRAMLRVFDGERLVRELEIALESRSFYIHGLPPGRPYRVEAHFVARSGRSRRIGSSTHPIMLPRTGASPDKTVRFMQLPPPPIVPVQGVPPPAVVATALSREAQGEEQVEERQYITWHRVPLPGSADLAAVPVSWRERTSRRGEGAGLPEHLEVTARPPGSSEQSVRRAEDAAPPEHLELPLRPPGSSEQMVRRAEDAAPPEHLEFPLRPPGSSEQMAGGGGAARGGASEQTHWTPPPSGRGR